jgi:hypothetical protein
MSERQLFKRMLSQLSGLTIDVEKLFLADHDRVLVISRILEMHPSDGPDRSLDKEMLHNSLLKLMETCHIERDAMWYKSRMEPCFWHRVRDSTPWARGMDYEILRTLALGLTQAAWSHLWNPKVDRKGERRPCCKLAMAALRFAADIESYEDHFGKQEKPEDMNFSELRAPAILENGKRLRGRHFTRKQTTVAVLPANSYGFAFKPRAEGDLSDKYDLTSGEPPFFGKLVRI